MLKLMLIIFLLINPFVVFYVSKKMKGEYKIFVEAIFGLLIMLELAGLIILVLILNNVEFNILYMGE